MKYFLIFLLTSSALFANCQTTKNKIITLNPFLTFQNYEHFKRLTLSSPDSHIEFLDDFNFEWGYTYKLSVKETELDEDLSDGTQFEYSLKKIISKTKMPDSAQFKLFLDSKKYYQQEDSSDQEGDLALRQLNDSIFLYFDKVEILVPKKWKADFDLIANGERSRLGNFIFINEKRIKLVDF